MGDLIGRILTKIKARKDEVKMTGQNSFRLVTPEYSSVLRKNSLFITPKYSKYSKVLRSTPKYSEVLRSTPRSTLYPLSHSH
eukprot:scaffold22848_cov165-Skeletonema_dohrnii-CCMP3373.AAC.1